MVKKTLIYIGITLVLCAACFFAGGVGPGKRADSLADRAEKLQGQLDESIKVVGSLREANKEFERINSRLRKTNSELECTIGDLQKINKKLGEEIIGISVSNGAAGQGIEEAQAGIEEVIEGIGKYLN